MISQHFFWSPFIPKVHGSVSGAHFQDLLEMAPGALHYFWLLKRQTFVWNFVIFVLIQATPSSAVDIISGILGLSDTTKCGATLCKLCCLRENLETMGTTKSWEMFTASLSVPKRNEKWIKAWQCLQSWSCAVGGWFFIALHCKISRNSRDRSSHRLSPAPWRAGMDRGHDGLESKHIPSCFPPSFEAWHILSCQNHTPIPRKHRWQD